MKIICLIISETVEAIPITSAKIVQLKVKLLFSQSDDLALHPRSQLHIKLDKCLTCTIIAVWTMILKLGLTVDLCMTYLLMLVTMTLTLMQGHSGLEMANIQCWIISATLATMVGLFCVTLTLTTPIWLDQNVSSWFKYLWILNCSPLGLYKYFYAYLSDLFLTHDCTWLLSIT